MVSAVLLFAAITAVFEGLLLYKYTSIKLMESKLFAATIHLLAFGINLVVHWGTMTGTMTAVCAALVSFAVYPCVMWLKVFVKEWRNGKATANSA